MYLLRIVLTLVVAASVVLGKPSSRDCFCSTVDNSVVSHEAQWDLIKTWPNGIVYYVIADGVFDKTEKRKIKKAMRDLEQHGLRFKRRTNETGYIELNRNTPDCFAIIGYRGKKQDLILGKKCMEHYIIVHELMHALGFHHEHTRFDRDKFVKIVTENIREDEKYNFDIRERPMIYETVDYDFKSIMHYEWDAFAKVKRTPTIIPLEQHGIPPEDLGGKTLTERDIKKLKILYP